MTTPVISHVAVRGLFGLYDYDLRPEGDLGSVAILYGDNGTGKTTLLKLAFHLLSPANDRGHRTFLYKADFDKLEVKLSNGHTVRATLIKEAAVRILHLEIEYQKSLIAVWDYHGPEFNRYVSDESGFEIEIDSSGRPSLKTRKKRYPPGVEFVGNISFLSVLQKISPALYMLNDERRIESDGIEPRRATRLEEKSARDANHTVAKDVALTEALRAAASWIAKNGLMVANLGSMNVHTAYITMLRQFTGPSKGREDNSEVNVAKLIEQISNVQTMIDMQSTYELTSPISLKEFKSALQERSDSHILANILQQYIQSLESRLKAVNPVYLVVNIFISNLNDLLRDKKISYKVGSGFRITNFAGRELTTANLSSGEQHLLLLFCYLLIARDKDTVFIIDEPEISLNIKWQRKLIKYLTDIVGEERIQLIFASHSFEVLSQHKDCVVRLDPAAKAE